MKAIITNEEGTMKEKKIKDLESSLSSLYDDAIGYNCTLDCDEYQLEEHNEITTEERDNIKQALTDYTKQTEMLVALREKCQMELNAHIELLGEYDKLNDDQQSYRRFVEGRIKDITTILEGGKA
jgi:hypothetical protein